MAAPNPSDLQVAAPTPAAATVVAEAQVQQAVPAAASVPEPKADYVDPGSVEDRILSPEETKNAWNTGSIEEPEPVAAPEVTQEQQAVDFFRQMPGQPEAQPGTQVQPGQAPAQLPQAVQDAAVQQTLAQAQQPVQQAPGTVAPAVTPAVVPAPVQQSPQEVALTAQVQTLMTQVAGLTGQVQAQAQQAPAQAQVQPQQPTRFSMVVPQQYMTALSSENPGEAHQAMNNIINGVAEAVRQQVTQETDQKFEAYGPVVQQQLSAETQRADIKRDMYGTYPELSGMTGQVAAVAEQMHGAGLASGQWSPDLRDNIAERLAPLIPGLAEKVMQNRAARGIQVQVNQPQPQQQILPQNTVQQVLPPGVAPAQIMGGTHVQPAVQQGPMLVRDAAGNISQVFPQQTQQLAGPQARPGGQGQVDPTLQDIWSTLGYNTR
ncbi:hypothetical protein LCGC14_1045340 [marine sediment metagenome]|uniref:Uncharacterized protein n=1 Tax=marine sediment metagenome TaxID=412755 RepID=A0A0F9NC86_9ZZZZ